MEFKQQQLNRATLLALRPDGLFVSQRDGRGQLDIAVEVPYEELLPMRVEHRNVVPQRQILWGLFGAIWVAVNYLRPSIGHAQPLTDTDWLIAFGVGFGLIASFLYGQRNWWHQTILHTGHLQLVLADHPRDRRALRAFIANLETHTKAYLRREYAPINPLGLIEPQLRRLAWLHELDVLATPEAQALATRLTGRLPGRGFKSMGQKLEAPYIN